MPTVDVHPLFQKRFLREDTDPRYITINLDLEEEQVVSDALMYGPFDTYSEATDYGNRNMQFFTVNELWRPDND